MNGRLYDPEVGRMLSPDNYIQDGGYFQNYNRYSYALNNPLKYTDPSGEVILPLLVSVGIGLLTNGLSNTMDGKPFFQGATRSIAFSILTYGISSGIGDAAKAAVEKGLLKASEVFVFQAMAHGFAGGLISAMQGGKFMHGFASGGLSSLASSASIALQALKAGPVPTVLIGGIAGGLGSVISGGDFFNGFRYGAISSAFNHVEHEIIKQTEVATIYFTTDGVGHTFLEIDGTVYTYGRYGARTPESSGDLAPSGEGILHKYTGKAAKNYIKSVTSKSEYFSYKVSIKSKQSVHEYYNSLIKNGQSVDKYTYNVDTYRLISNNCTTHSLNALRAGGAEIPFIITPSGAYQYFFPPQNYELIYSKWDPKY